MRNTPPVRGKGRGGAVATTVQQFDKAPMLHPMGERLARARLLAFLVPAALLIGALGSQYLGGLVPCEMCYWQRWPHYAALGLALLAFAARSFARPLVILAALAIAMSGAIGVYHAGVELGIFEGVTTCAAPLSTGSTADALKSILATPLIRCDQVQFSFLGVSMAGWNAIISLGAAGLILWLARRA